MKEKMSWVSWPLTHYPISLLIIGLLFLLGIFGMVQMPKDEFPEITIRQGIVAAVYPGATSEEVEEQVARPLERYLYTFNEVNRVKTTSTSQNGMCIVMVRLNDEVNNKDEVWSKIKHGLNTFKTSLPSGVLAVVANDDFGNTSALLIAIESEQRSYRELQKYSDDLSDRLRRIPSVANVKLFGEQKEQISLYVDRQRLQAYGIGQQALFTKLQSQGITTMSGSIVDGDQNTPIHVAATESSEEEIANQIIFSEPQTGKVVRVKDVARVVREYDRTVSYIEQDGHPCVLLSMEMTPGNNIVQYGEEVDEVLDEFRQTELPDLFVSMAIIIVVMMLLFPIRSAIVAAITIPVSTFISVAIMYMVGIPLNIVTLAALIVVLGMIVDNSIVVIDGYLEYLDKGMRPREAAVESVKQYFMPMMLATVCICAIFFPLLSTITGSTLDVIHDFPFTITINLMVSLAVAVALIPLLNVWLIKPKKKDDGKEKKRTLTDYVQDYYDRLLKVLFRHPWLTIGAGVAIVALSLLIAPKLKIRLFPYSDRDQFAIEIYLPEGKGLQDTRLVADSMRTVLQRDERVKSITSFIGCSSPRFQATYAPQMGGRNFAQFIINTTSQEATLELLADYQPQWSEAFPEAYVKFKRLDFLECTEMEYRFYGENLDSLHTVAERMMERMREMPELEWVHTDYLQPFPLIDVELDPVASAQLGINRMTASMALSATSSDLRVGQLWEGDYELPIIVKDDADMTYADVENLGITSPMAIASAALSSTMGGEHATNSAVPLRQIAKVKPAWSESRIMHRGGERCITVTAHFAQGVFTAAVEKRLAEMQHEIAIPQGIRTEVGGEIEHSNETVPQVASGICIALVIIFFFLLFNFKKYGITVVCMAAITLCLPGSLLGLLIMNRTLGITAIFGFITLMGMIMRNEILIFEHAGDLVKKFAEEHPDCDRNQYNEALRQAAIDAGSRRMVPIFLTTATTAVGVVPMIIAQSAFWMPVGVTIFAGGIGSLILVVTVLPVVYWKVSKK